MTGTLEARNAPQPRAPVAPAQAACPRAGGLAQDAQELAWWVQRKPIGRNFFLKYPGSLRLIP